MSVNTATYIDYNAIKESDRIPFFKNTLCKNYELTLTTPAAARQKFGLGKGEIDRSNVVTGECEGYEFCLCEYYHHKCSKYDSSKWQVACSIRMKENNFPKFNLGLKNTTECLIIFIILLPFSILCIAGIGFGIYSGIDGIGLILLFLLTGWFPIYTTFENGKRLFQLLRQGRFDIRNKEFKERFAITDVNDYKSVKKLFTSNICNRIMEFVPKINTLKSNGNCLHFIANTKLSETNLESLVENYINQAKIFDTNAELETPLLIRGKFFEENICKKNKVEYIKEYQRVKSKFGFDLQTDAKHPMPRLANALVGNFDDHEYCIIEYFFENGTNLTWENTIAFQLKQADKVNFELVSDYKKELKFFPLLIILGSLLLFIPIFIYLIIVLCNSHKTEEYAVTASFVFISLYIIELFFKFGIKTIKTRSTFKKGIKTFKYLTSSGFSNNYTFINFKDEDISRIKRIMTPRVCGKIMKHEPKIKELQCLNGHLHITQKGQIKEDNLEITVLSALTHAKLFEDE